MGGGGLGQHWTMLHMPFSRMACVAFNTLKGRDHSAAADGVSWEVLSAAAPTTHRMLLLCMDAAGYSLLLNRSNESILC